MSINIFVPLTVGGPTTWAENLKSELARKNVKARVFSKLPQYFLEPFLTDVVHSTLPFFTRPLGRYILTIHGNYLVEENIWTRFYPTAIKIADIITVPSHYLKKELGIKNALVIPNGICIPGSKQREYKSEPVFGIMTSFNFIEKANGLIDLAKCLEKVVPGARLLIAGDGKCRDKIRERISKNKIRAEFLGFCDREEFFNSIDVYSYYSHLDTFGISVLEAMARKIPTISNKVGGVTELFSGNLEKYVASNSQEYEKILRKVVENKSEWEKNITLCFERAKQYSWDNIIGQWLKIYKH